MLRIRYVLVALCCLPTVGAAQGLAGYSPAGAARQRSLEQFLDSVVQPSRVREDSRTLASSPHVAGTPAQARTANYVLQQLAAAGFDTMRVSFRAYIPYQDSAIVELVAPTHRRFQLEESPLREDPATQGKIWPAMNGYSGIGDVTGDVVYANFGLPSDYATLDSMGVSVRGRIVLARYGRSFRGIKAREAEARGAAALLLYSDPQDDGYFVGPTYPNGPMRPGDSPQRGSVDNTDPGDASTPGWPSGPDARRLPQDSIPGPRIPVIPLGYRNAQALLQPLGGAEVPQAWQGGLPLRYRIGPGGVRVRVAVWAQRGEQAYKTLTNTIAVLRGTERPDRWVLAGGHRDAWGPGAADNVSGVTTILEAGRAIGAAAAAGYRPKRTIILATWDGEEWGLVGSQEWVEMVQDSLRQRAVAYLNFDMSAFGRRFHASGTASLWALLRDLAVDSRQPGDSISVYTAWRRDTRLADTASVRIGDLGGGSDFSGFYNYLGIPAAEFGFGGRYGAYHSAYDTFTWMDRFGDPGFLSGAAAASMAAVGLTRLANAELLPYDYAEFARALAGMVTDRRREAEAHKVTLAGWAGMDSAVAQLMDAGARYDDVLRALSTLHGRRGPSAAELDAANDSLRVTEQAFVRPGGIPGRPYYQNILIAPGRDDGYGSVTLPGIAEAIEDGKAGVAESELVDLTARTRRAAALVNGGVAALGAPAP
jgi:N-acetylated-alpha-linked acidic dipeptidase